MFQIKICGITSVDDAVMVTRAGADAIGLNFYPRSPRFVAFDLARKIVDSVPKTIKKVGLFVNTPVDEMAQAFDLLGLDLIQLHGDEPSKCIAELAPRPVMRAFRLGADGLAPVFEYLDKCVAPRPAPEYVLFDAQVAGSYGGTGVTTDWATAREYVQRLNMPRLVLAGGLTSENVAAAIRAVWPMAVDTASGVESSPGCKDAAKVTAFVQAAKNAFQQSVGWAPPTM